MTWLISLYATSGKLEIAPRAYKYNRYIHFKVILLTIASDGHPAFLWIPFTQCSHTASQDPGTSAPIKLESFASTATKMQKQKNQAKKKSVY